MLCLFLCSQTQLLLICVHAYNGELKRPPTCMRVCVHVAPSGGRQSKLQTVPQLQPATPTLPGQQGLCIPLFPSFFQRHVASEAELCHCPLLCYFLVFPTENSWVCQRGAGAADVPNALLRQPLGLSSNPPQALYILACLVSLFLNFFSPIQPVLKLQSQEHIQPQ